MRTTYFMSVILGVFPLQLFFGVAHALVPRPLIQAVESGDRAKVKEQIDILPETDRIMILNEPTWYYRKSTLLHLAVTRNDETITEYLLDREANVNARDRYDMTPLHEAASRGFDPIVKTLIARGADPRALNEKNQTPQDVAQLNQHLELARFLAAEEDARRDPSEVLADRERAARAALEKDYFDTLSEQLDELPKSEQCVVCLTSVFLAKEIVRCQMRHPICTSCLDQHTPATFHLRGLGDDVSVSCPACRGSY